MRDFDAPYVVMRFEPPGDESKPSRVSVDRWYWTLADALAGAHEMNTCEPPVFRACRWIIKAGTKAHHPPSAELRARSSQRMRIANEANPQVA